MAPAEAEAQCAELERLRLVEVSHDVCRRRISRLFTTQSSNGPDDVLRRLVEVSNDVSHKDLVS